MVFKIILMIHSKKYIQNPFQEQRSETERDLTSFDNQQILQKATSISASSCSAWQIFSVHHLVKLVDVFSLFGIFDFILFFFMYFIHYSTISMSICWCMFWYRCRVSCSKLPLVGLIIN